MTSITLDHFLFLGAILFTIGVLGIFLNKKNVIIILMSDGAFGSIKSRAIEKNLNYSSLIIPKRSWKKTLESYDIPSTIITNLQGLEKYLSTKTFKSLPLFVECHFNPSKYMEMITDLRY